MALWGGIIGDFPPRLSLLATVEAYGGEIVGWVPVSYFLERDLSIFRIASSKPINHLGSSPTLSLM